MTLPLSKLTTTLPDCKPITTPPVSYVPDFSLDGSTIPNSAPSPISTTSVLTLSSSIPSIAALPVTTPPVKTIPPATLPASTPTQPLFNVGDIHYLEPHATAIKCMFSSGPCLFTASEDATVHVYDLKSGQLSMRVLGHQEQVTCLYSIALTATSKELKNATSTPEYLQHLNLITGSKDGYVRQFSLADGNLLHEKSVNQPITCMVASRPLACFFIGTDSGAIYSYNIKDNVINLAPFKVNYCQRNLESRIFFLFSKISSYLFIMRK